MIYKIDPRRTALLVIDVQKEYFKANGPAYIPASKKVLPNILQAIDIARKNQILVIYIQHVNRADGSDIGRMADFGSPDDEKSFVEGTPEVDLVAELSPVAGEVTVQKRRYSSFAGTDLESVLRTKDINTVIISGYMTSFCCETTARDAHSRDYRVLFLADANEGPDLTNVAGDVVPHDAVLNSTLTALAAGFAEIVTIADLNARLTDKAKKGRAR
ncbi:cysteine hydrolase family protein [Rhodoferax sp.]|uniref:cysteine hydrolase family protein n=1 Tax=Rhodoferax sp. TaxID=50421 RepID=UPI002746FB03|nr:isochorismatase family cysteine hydrolase [Rhodoferax sp.]